MVNCLYVGAGAGWEVGRGGVRGIFLNKQRSTLMYSRPWTPYVPVVKGGGCNER